jgi:prevent-host-death family protein
MLQVNVSELRKHLPDYLKQVGHGEEICITSHGKTVARIVPERDEADQARLRLRALRGTMILGDVVSPVEDVEWTGDENNL